MCDSSERSPQVLSVYSTPLSDDTEYGSGCVHPAIHHNAQASDADLFKWRGHASLEGPELGVRHGSHVLYSREFLSCLLL